MVASVYAAYARWWTWLLRKWLAFGSEVRYEGLMAEGILYQVKGPTAYEHADLVKLNPDGTCAVVAGNDYLEMSASISWISNHIS